jgi:replicative DNA helicase
MADRNSSNNNKEQAPASFLIDYSQLSALVDVEAEAGLISLAFEDVEYFSLVREAGVTPAWFFGDVPRALFGLFSDIMRQPGITGLTEMAVVGAINLLAAETTEARQELLAGFRKLIGQRPLPSYLTGYIERAMRAYQSRILADKLSRAYQILIGSVEDRAGANPDKIMSYVEAAISEARTVSSPIDLLTAGQLTQQTQEFLQDRLAHGGPRTGEIIPFPLAALNEATDGGAGRQEFTIISAPPKVGKTALLQDIALSSAGVRVMFSLEMPRFKFMARGLQQQIGLPARRVERGQFAEWQNVVFGQLSRLSDQSFYFSDNTSTTTDSMFRSLEHVERAEGKIDLVFLDYIQLLRDQRGQEEHQTLKYIVAQLSAMSKRFNCHLFAISNLNKAGGLHGSTFLEYGCDNWWLVTNDKATQADLAPGDKSGPANIVLKFQRYGTSGENVPTYWNSQYCKFSDEPLPVRDWYRRP